MGALRLLALAVTATLALAPPGPARQVPLGKGSVVAAVRDFRPGDFIWEPRLSPTGPLVLVVNATSQRALLFRNGVPIAATTVSTGRPGYRTPTGAFTILQKQVEHHSSKYDNAPMPYMQRLTWGGIALHAGTLPGYPASHGCIRLPFAFAQKLYATTHIGMTVLVTDVDGTPRFAPNMANVFGSAAGEPAAARPFWQPELAQAGPVSILISARDSEAVVLRNGVMIGRSGLVIEGEVRGTSAFIMQDAPAGKRRWLRIDLEADRGTVPVEPGEGRRFTAPPAFAQAVAAMIVPGTTVVLTADSLKPGGPETPSPVLEGEK